METVQVVLSSELLKAADRQAKKNKTNRSMLMRTALQEYLDRQRLAELERRDAAGYTAFPDQELELRGWERVAAWPEE